MLRRILLLLILIALSLSLTASPVYLGFDAGYAINFMSTKTPWPLTEYALAHGADVKLAIEYFPLNWLSLNTGVRYIQKGYSYTERTDALAGNTLVAKYSEMHHYLEFPLTLRFTLPVTEDLRLFCGFGGYLGWWMFSHAHSVEEVAYFVPDSGIMEFDNSDNRFEAGLIAEAGCDFFLSENARILITLNYLRGLTSTVKDNQKNSYHRYNDTFSITAGARFAIGG